MICVYMDIYIYIYMCVCVCVYLCIFFWGGGLCVILRRPHPTEDAFAGLDPGSSTPIFLLAACDIRADDRR